MSERTVDPRGTLCLGEAVVDLIAQRRGEPPVAHLGGAAANVAVAAARAGGRVGLAGGVGDDENGRWLRERLAAAGVGTDRLALLPGVATQVAHVAVGPGGEPAYAVPEIVTDTLPAALGGDLAAAVNGASGLCLSSLTLAGPAERALTMRARQTALDAQRPVILDVNVRLHRWSSRADAAASVNACVPEALLVRANRAEAELLTGEPDPERAALALRKAGAEVVVITLGADGAMLRAARRLRLDLPAAAVAVRCTVGAGDALTGTLLAALERTAYYPDAVAAALDDALAAAGEACTRWGASD